LVGVGVSGCGSASPTVDGGAAGDGAGADREDRTDGADSAGPRDDGGAAPDQATAPARSCRQNQDCPAREFCGTASKTCVSAVVQVAAGAQHSCALHDDGHVTCWGLAESILAGGAQPLRPQVMAGVDHLRALSAGSHLTCAIAGDRTLRCWGNEELTVLGPDAARLADVQAVALGDDFGCAVTPAGTLCWGHNDFGQLAQPLALTDSANAVLSLPAPAGASVTGLVGTGVAVITIRHQSSGGDQLCAWGRNATHLISATDDLGVQIVPQCRAVGDVADLAVGDTHACVRHGDGTFTCWGERYYGQLGVGGTETADLPPPGAATSLPGGVPVSALVAGVNHTCALLMNATVICFGRNNLGQVGPGAPAGVEEVRTPVAVAGFAGKVIALGSGSTAQHTCAILAEGSVQCWGSDGAGQLGDEVPDLDPARQSHGPVTVGF
jgi:alpha-tubulin suppressor-like RCC1 family protein